MLPLCLAVLDLDNLKAINERHGYSTGDMVMRQWGQLLRQTFRQNTVIARWEGEFDDNRARVFGTPAEAELDLRSGDIAFAEAAEED